MTGVIDTVLVYKLRRFIDDKEFIQQNNILSLIKEKDEKVVTYLDITEFDSTNSVGELMKVALRYTSDT